jgi:hypothetical protein
MKVKNWSDFQHFKDRTPPWIKLYRYLLDDPDWHELDGDSAKTLVMLWLIASEDKKMQGNLPSLKALAFRLRISESKLKQSLNKLSHWLIQDDIAVISTCHQVVIPETETEAETEAETYSCAFDEFWSAYPKKTGKDAALKAWKLKKPRIDDVMYALSWQRKSWQWLRESGQYIPNPATYINQGRWQDEPQTETMEAPF